MHCPGITFSARQPGYLAETAPRLTEEMVFWAMLSPIEQGADRVAQ